MDDGERTHPTGPQTDAPAEALSGAATPSAYLEAAHRAIVQAAVLAPSVHNSQPWSFTRDDGGLDLYADVTRQLPALDPEGRLLRLSCGAALLHAQVAARAQGLFGTLSLLPDTDDPAHLARLDLTAGRPGSAADLSLAEAVLHRHTHRGAFTATRLPDALLQRLRVACEAQGAALVTVTGDDLLELEVLLAWADGLQEAEPAYRAEVAASLRRGTSDDGIPLSALAADPERGSSLRLRDFAHVAPARGGDDPPVPEKPDVVLVVTDGDGPYAWLQAGQAMAAVLLGAAQEGVMGQPLAQVTDFPAARVRLRAALGLVGTPQMALRLGYATGTAATPRRQLDDVLAVTVADPARG